MYQNRLYHTALMMLILFLATPLAAQAAPEFATREEYIQWMYHNAPIVNEIMVKFKPGIEPKPKAALPKKKLKELSKFVGHRFSVNRIDHLEDWQLLELDRRMTQEEVEAICVKLRQHPDVEGADPNGSVFAMMTSTDPRFTDQWSLQTGVGATEVTKAWDITSGAAAIVVAVIDSGITVHEDLAAARILPGYDFVSDPVLANDGGGRDADVTDPGDWLTQAESNSSSGPLRGCQVQPNSSWHGTHVAGTIAATPNNGKGIAGIDWQAKLLPVRALGKCRGDPFDVSDAVSWAAGASVGGLQNPSPAKVINMSLSGSGTCPLRVQTAIDTATKRGALVVAAAGNQGAWGSFWPANCNNVVTVVATDKQGKRASFSNFGTGVSVSAPGVGVLSTVNPGTTVPVAGSAYAEYSGTSMAAAHVSGVASLMFGLNPDLTPAQAKLILMGTARPFARDSAVVFGDCVSSWCGAGMVNAPEAVRQARASTPSAGSDFALQRMPDGTVASWGRNDFGQLGDGTTTTVRSNPAKIVPGLASIARVNASFHTAVAFTKTGEAYAWGQDKGCNQTTGLCFPIFGTGGLNPASPIRVPAFDGVRMIAMSPESVSWKWDLGVFAVTASGTVLAWGEDTQGRLGLGLPPNMGNVVQTPTAIAGLPPIAAVAAGPYTTGAVGQDGSVWSWGYNGGALLGTGSNQELSNVPVRVLLSNVIDVKYVGWTFIALKSDGTIWFWGYSAQVGFPDAPTPVQVAIDKVVAISEDGKALRSDGSVWSVYPPTAPQKQPNSGAVDVAGSFIRYANGQLFSSNMLADLNVGYTDLNKSNLAVTITSTPTSVAAGQAVVYQVSVNNVQYPAKNVQVSVALDPEMTIVSLPLGCSTNSAAIVCVLGDMAAGTSRVLSINAKLAANASAGGKAATAYVQNDYYNSNTTTSTAGVDIMVAAAPTDGDIPTLPEWGVMLMGSLLLGNMVWMERRKYRR